MLLPALLILGVQQVKVFNEDTSLIKAAILQAQQEFVDAALKGKKEPEFVFRTHYELDGRSFDAVLADILEEAENPDKQTWYKPDQIAKLREIKATPIKTKFEPPKSADLTNMVFGPYFVVRDSLNRGSWRPEGSSFGKEPFGMAFHVYRPIYRKDGKYAIQMFGVEGPHGIGHEECFMEKTLGGWKLLTHTGWYPM